MAKMKFSGLFRAVSISFFVTQTVAATLPSAQPATVGMSAERLAQIDQVVQQAIERTVARAVELLGGMAFISSPDVAYLFAASRALAFHPPARLSVASAIDDYLMGQPMQVA